MPDRLSPAREQEIRKNLASLPRWVWDGSPRVYCASLLAELDAVREENNWLREERAAWQLAEIEADTLVKDRYEAELAAANERVRELETALGDIARALLAQS